MAQWPGGTGAAGHNHVQPWSCLLDEGLQDAIDFVVRHRVIVVKQQGDWMLGLLKGLDQSAKRALGLGVQ